MVKKKITEEMDEMNNVSMPVTMKLEHEVTNIKQEIADLGEDYRSSISSIAEDNAKIQDSIKKIKKDAEKVELKYMMPRRDREDKKEYEQRLKKDTPTYAHDGDIGMDMVAIDVEYDAQHDRYIYHTGFYCETKKRIGMFLLPRSSNSKTSAYLCNSPGLVDPYQYRGEVMWVFKNRTSIGTRAQLEAMKRWNKMNFIQKFFKCYDHFEQEVIREFVDRAMDYAPYRVGDHLGQMYLGHCPEVVLKKVNKLSKTERGTGGFGSTGK
jgi:dUTPase